MSRLATSLLLFAALIPMIPGCGGNDFGPIGSIAGKLTLDGNTLPAGTKVIFTQPTKGYTGFSLTNEAGEYRIEWRRSGKTFDGMPVGNYQVMLVPEGAIDIDEVSAEDMLAGGPKPNKPQVAIPPRFLRATTSGLSFDVAEGENTINIDATSKP
ncbi:hypothetical protein [Aureliella helgolandensis]|uniref:Carboxypeptidase regulatory-like domain-containing protein n=1 Tax=Aureliella helgolandensis TaxID=2527968 RepID=A0A518GGD9_9BACT|nr:hypothetical protein [Aureliella helgolandensis]QDV27672.1 hypothetical protein Q31a_60650 [Aureliella helgolandensis]